MYDLSKALKIVLVPDGDISDLDDDDCQSDDETKNLNPISVFNKDEITMPEIESLEFELQQAGAIVNQSDISFDIMDKCSYNLTNNTVFAQGVLSPLLVYLLRGLLLK